MHSSRLLLRDIIVQKWHKACLRIPKHRTTCELQIVSPVRECPLDTKNVRLQGSRHNFLYYRSAPVACSELNKMMLNDFLYPFRNRISWRTVPKENFFQLVQFKLSAPDWVFGKIGAQMGLGLEITRIVVNISNKKSNARRAFWLVRLVFAGTNLPLYFWAPSNNANETESEASWLGWNLLLAFQIHW